MKYSKSDILNLSEQKELDDLEDWNLYLRKLYESQDRRSDPDLDLDPKEKEECSNN